MQLRTPGIGQNMSLEWLTFHNINACLFSGEMWFQRLFMHCCLVPGHYHRDENYVSGNTCIPHTQEVGLLDKTQEQMGNSWMNVY